MGQLHLSNKQLHVRLDSMESSMMGHKHVDLLQGIKATTQAHLGALQESVDEILRHLESSSSAKDDKERTPSQTPPFTNGHVGLPGKAHFDSRRELLSNAGAGSRSTSVSATQVETPLVCAASVETWALRINGTDIVKYLDVEFEDLKRMLYLLLGFMTKSPTLSPTPLPTPSTLAPTAIWVLADVAGSSSGWTSDDSHCTGIHGPFSNSLTTNSKTFPLNGAPHTRLRIVGSLISFASRDSEYDRLFVDGTLRFSVMARGGSCGAAVQTFESVLSSDASVDPIFYSDVSTDYCPWAAAQIYQYSPIQACEFPFDLTLSHTSDSVDVSFTSAIDEPLYNEAWGFSGINIYILATADYTDLSDVAGTSKGWLSDTSHCSGIHGPFSDSFKSNSKTFSLSGAPHTMVRLTGTVVSFASRDNELDKLFLDGNLVYSVTARGGSCSTATETYTSDVTYSTATPTYYSDVSSSFCPWAATYITDYSPVTACVFHFDLTSTHSTENLEVKFTSDIDEPLNNEAWGFGNVELTLL